MVQLGHPDVSSWHAELRPTTQGWAIWDSGSTNGVRVDGVPLERPCPVHTGTLLELGSCLIRLVDLSEPKGVYLVTLSMEDSIRGLRLNRIENHFTAEVLVRTKWQKAPDIGPLPARLLWALLEKPGEFLHIADERDLFEKDIKNNNDARIYTNRNRLRLWWRKTMAECGLSLLQDPLHTPPLMVRWSILIPKVELPSGSPLG